MKRCWFGLGLLVVMLIGGLLVAHTMEDGYAYLADRLQQAEEAAIAGDWTRAEALLQKAKGIWLGKWRFSACLADHEPMEVIDRFFARAEVYLQCRDSVSLAAVCGELVKMTEEMGEAHTFNWWNLL